VALPLIIAFVLVACWPLNPALLPEPRKLASSGTDHFFSWAPFLYDACIASGVGLTLGGVIQRAVRRRSRAEPPLVELLGLTSACLGVRGALWCALGAAIGGLAESASARRSQPVASNRRSIIRPAMGSLIAAVWALSTWRWRAMIASEYWPWPLGALAASILAALFALWRHAAQRQENQPS
jgi:hypothetical protein